MKTLIKWALKALKAEALPIIIDFFLGSDGEFKHTVHMNKTTYTLTIVKH